jgi:hypothetical protein
MRFETEANLRKLADNARPDVKGLALKALELQTADKFRLAALLLDRNEAEMAEAIGTRACQELQLVLLFEKKSVTRSPEARTP